MESSRKNNHVVSTLDEDDILDQEIAEEERWIRILDTELALESSHAAKSSLAAQKNNDSVLDGWEDAMDWLLEINDGNSDQMMSNLLRKVAEQEGCTATAELDRLQTMLRNFCFNKVENCMESNPIAKNTYVFQGYFLSNRTCHANIKVRVTRAPHHHTVIDTVSCTLYPEEWTWVGTQVSSIIKNSFGLDDSSHFMASWITAVAEYLEFDHHRSRKLQSCRPRRDCGCPQQFDVQNTSNSSKKVLTIPIQKHSHISERKPDHFLCMVWEWRWRERRETLRLDSTTTSLRLRQSDLDQLVLSLNGDCFSTIQLLLAHCSGCLCWRRRERGSLRQNKRQPTGLQDPVHDADDEGEDNEDEEVDDDHSDSRPSHSSSSFRFSPSGRRRSDYEVQRLERIKRNEARLSQLGLLKQQVVKAAPARRGGGKKRGRRSASHSRSKHSK